MIKKTLIYLLLFLSLKSFTQNSMSGVYNFFCYTLQLFEDNTFHIDYYFDLSHDFGHGKYKVFNDTIILNYVAQFDTVYYDDTIKEQNHMRYGDNDIHLRLEKIRKLLVHRNDSIDVKESDYEYICCRIDEDLYPKKLFYKKEKLFFIKKNGKLNRRKQKSLDRRKFDGYFKKIK